MSYGNHFLDSLPAADAQALRPVLREVRLEPGEIVIEQGGGVPIIHFPITAQLTNVIVYEDGSAIETAVIGREGVSGLAPFMSDQPCGWQVVVRAGGGAWVGSAVSIREQAYASRPLMEHLLRLAHVYEAQAAQTAACNAQHRTTARVARWLLVAADLTPGEPIIFTQEELAGFLGAQRTTVNEATNRLKDLGAIRYSRGVIRILDRSALEAAACECYAMHIEYKRRAGLLPDPEPASGA